MSGFTVPLLLPTAGKPSKELLAIFPSLPSSKIRGRIDRLIDGVYDKKRKEKKKTA